MFFLDLLYSLLSKYDHDKPNGCLHVLNKLATHLAKKLSVE